MFIKSQRVISFSWYHKRQEGWMRQKTDVIFFSALNHEEIKIFNCFLTEFYNRKPVGCKCVWMCGYVKWFTDSFYNMGCTAECVWKGFGLRWAVPEVRASSASTAQLLPPSFTMRRSCQAAHYLQHNQDDLEKKKQIQFQHWSWTGREQEMMWVRVKVNNQQYVT